MGNLKKNRPSQALPGDVLAFNREDNSLKILQKVAEEEQTKLLLEKCTQEQYTDV